MEAIDHRPYPRADGPWVMGQRWHDLLFAHWRVDPAALQALLPAGLEIETFDGSAWLAVVPFAMTDVRMRGLPVIGAVADFLELNVRTYVRTGDTSGVYFFSLDAASMPAVAAGRRWFHLPYFNARMELRHRGNRIDYQSLRSEGDGKRAQLALTYEPTGPAEYAEPGSLEAWLVERYRLITSHPDGTLIGGEIHHAPWRLQPARVEIFVNTMTDWLGLALPTVPDHVRFARFQDVYIWRPRRLSEPPGDS